MLRISCKNFGARESSFTKILPGEVLLNGGDVYVLAKAVQGGDRTNIRPSQGWYFAGHDRATGHDWAPLTGDKI